MGAERHVAGEVGLQGHVPGRLEAVRLAVRESFDPRQIPRIRDKEKIKEDDCKQFCSTAWLEWLAKNPDKRYTSDGNPATIAFPQDKMIYLYSRYKEWACAY